MKSLVLLMLAIAFCAIGMSCIPVVVEKGPALEFLKENWAVLAFVVSEVVSFLPTKAGGIIQAVLRIGKAIFQPADANKLPRPK